MRAQSFSNYYIFLSKNDFNLSCNHQIRTQSFSNIIIKLFILFYFIRPWDGISRRNPIPLRVPRISRPIPIPSRSNGMEPMGRIHGTGYPISFRPFQTTWYVLFWSFSTNEPKRVLFGKCTEIDGVFNIWTKDKFSLIIWANILFPTTKFCWDSGLKKFTFCRSDFRFRNNICANCVASKKKSTDTRLCSVNVNFIRNFVEFIEIYKRCQNVLKTYNGKNKNRKYAQNSTIHFLTDTNI